MDDTERNIFRDDLDRCAHALERMAAAVESWVKIEQLRYEHEYPARNPAPATFAVAKYGNDESKGNPEEHGSVFPEEYEGIGPREKAMLEKNKSKERKVPIRRSGS